jgi:hypothetical protein
LLAADLLQNFSDALHLSTVDWASSAGNPSPEPHPDLQGARNDPAFPPLPEFSRFRTRDIALQNPNGV